MTGRIKRVAGRLAACGIVACGAAAALYLYGMLPFWAYAAVTVLGFPAAVVALFLWWMADEGKEDIPFIGY
ncbi:MAG: hypothetical protein A4E35_00345 [Methanoregula sp. PtaU1.Bin051]|nr:MAG: hypothetical protein A4E35_00345 [Methanoregula sp. PtaU1.Bin051]